MENSSSLPPLLNSSSCEHYDVNSFRENIVVGIAVVGILLNLICLRVLVKPQLDSIFNRILITLSIADIGFLASVVSVCISFSTSSVFEDEVYVVLNKIVYMANAVSAQATLCIAVERFLAIFFAVQVDPSSRRRVFIMYLIPVLTLPFLVHAAFFIQETDVDRNLQYNLTIIGHILKFLSFFMLAVLNVMIYVKMKGLQKGPYGKNNDNKNSMILIIIATNSLIMYAPWGTFVVLNFTCGSKSLQQVFYTIAVYLFVLNSSCNFFIYNWANRKFREILNKEVLFCSASSTEDGESKSVPKTVLESEM